MKAILLFYSAILLAMPTNHNIDATVGKVVINVHLKNPNDKDVVLPFFGQKVLAIFYTDPDAKDVNDPLSDALKAKNLNKEKFQGIGIANCAETWLPNSMIRYAAREKEKKYPGSVVLIDETRILSKAWELPSGDDVGLIIVVGKDSKIKYIKPVKNQDESKAIIKKVIEVVESEIAK